MNQPNKFTIKKPRITLTEEQKKQARSGMAGEAVKGSGEAPPSVAVTPEPAKAPSVAEPSVSQVLPAALDPVPSASVEEEPFRRQGRGGKGRKPESKGLPAAEDSDTQHVRMSKDAVMRAKMNVLLLPPALGIRSLRDYGDAAFEFYEAHLRKTGKLPNR